MTERAYALTTLFECSQCFVCRSLLEESQLDQNRPVAPIIYFRLRLDTNLVVMNYNLTVDLDRASCYSDLAPRPTKFRK